MRQIGMTKSEIQTQFPHICAEPCSVCVWMHRTQGSRVDEYKAIMELLLARSAYGVRIANA